MSCNDNAQTSDEVCRENYSAIVAGIRLHTSSHFNLRQPCRCFEDYALLTTANAEKLVLITIG